MKNLSIVLVEAIVVGLTLMALVFVLNLIFKDRLGMWPGIFVSGALFHLIFEFAGLNKIYVDNYYKLT